MNIEIRGLCVRYGHGAACNTAIEGFDLFVKSGETCAVIGPSGCGKTTLIHVLSGIIKGYEGAALLNGIPADPRRQRIGLIPQGCGLFEWLSVLQNAELGVKTSGMKAQRQETLRMLSRLGLEGTEKRYPNTLSGGQKQRTAMARTLLRKPDILLMDEPFSSLDAITREIVQDVFLSIWSESPVTAVIVTHSMEEAVYLGRNIVVMSCAPGRVAALFQNPLFGQRRLRKSRCYYDLVAELRKQAKELWHICASPQ